MNTKIKLTLVSGRAFLHGDRSAECPIQKGQNSRETERTPEEIIRRLAHLNAAKDHELEDPCWTRCRFTCHAKKHLVSALVDFLRQK